MELTDLQKNWDRFGQIDPLWAILTVPEKINNRWDIGDFFQTGISEMQEILGYLNMLGIPSQKKRALDFGCGVGRLTQALCLYFDECCGIDIARSMIKLAKTYNQYGNRCEYCLNELDGLPTCVDDDWDFIYSSLVLQHMKPSYSKRYIREFLRILSPSGALVFQLPAELHAARPPENISDVILPDSAFRASIKPRRPFLTGSPRSQVELAATVKNLSLSTWPCVDMSSNCPIRLGNHWLNAKGEVLARDDARANLDHDLKPMEEAQLRLVVNTPAEPGNYILELDMVQECVAWFADKGSEVKRIHAKIKNSPSTPSRAVQRRVPPTMEMYGIPKDDVLETIANAGGEVLDVRPDFSAGPEWMSFRYFVTKPRPSK
jgi:SAM-dependent methyltransferase